MHRLQKDPYNNTKHEDTVNTMISNIRLQEIRGIFNLKSHMLVKPVAQELCQVERVKMNNLLAFKLFVKI